MNPIPISDTKEATIIILEKAKEMFVMNHNPVLSYDSDDYYQFPVIGNKISLNSLNYEIEGYTFHSACKQLKSLKILDSSIGDYYSVQINSYSKITHELDRLGLNLEVIEKRKERDLDMILKEKPTQGSSIENSLKSIHLISESIISTNVIFLILDRHFDKPIRCAVKNNKGEDTYIKKLFHIAYPVNVPGKKVSYDKEVGNSINNKLFSRRRIAKYMKEKKLSSPTIVKKSEEGDFFVLSGDIPVEIMTIANIPYEYKSFYIDKTR